MGGSMCIEGGCKQQLRNLLPVDFSQNSPACMISPSRRTSVVMHRTFSKKSTGNMGLSVPPAGTIIQSELHMWWLLLPPQVG